MPAGDHFCPPNWPSSTSACDFPWPGPTINAAPQGWQCPKCGSIWAPMIPGCLKCNQEPKIETKPGTGDVSGNVSPKIDGLRVTLPVKED